MTNLQASRTRTVSWEDPVEAAQAGKTGMVYGEGKIIHVGGRIATAEARLTDADGKLYAHATTTCIIFRPSPAPDGR